MGVKPIKLENEYSKLVPNNIINPNIAASLQLVSVSISCSLEIGSTKSMEMHYKKGIIVKLPPLFNYMIGNRFIRYNIHIPHRFCSLHSNLSSLYYTYHTTIILC